MRNLAVIRSKRLTRVHPTSYVHHSTRAARDLATEPFVFVGRQCEIGAGVSIGRYTMLASRVAVVGDDHNWDEVAIPMQFAGRPGQTKTDIGRDVWLGHGVIVIRGAHIGRGAIVAAGAVVTRDIPPYEVWGGVPARRLRERFSEPDDRLRHDRMIAGDIVAARFAAPQTA